jgi:hypothetical protein
MLTPDLGIQVHLRSGNDAKYNMFEADIHLRPLHTSILDINRMFQTLVCCVKVICLHPSTVTPAMLTPDLGIQVHLRSGNDDTTS